MSTDSIPMFLRMNLPSMVSPTRTLMISPFPENVAIGFAALPNVPMYLYVNGGGTGSGGGWIFRVIGPCWQASPTPFSSMSAWSGFATSGQLSRKSGMPSLSRSGGGGGGLGGGGGGRRRRLFVREEIAVALVAAALHLQPLHVNAGEAG